MIMQHLKRRIGRRTVSRTIADLRRDMAAARIAERRYDGGLPAELHSAARIRARRVADAKTKRRKALLSRVGRRIDLAAVLRQRQPDGTPRWTIVDPLKSVGGNGAEGRFDTDGLLIIGGTWRTIAELKRADQPRKAFVPLGIPALPQRVRDLATDPKVRRRANWVGILYQPEEWQEVEPDPALVVEWKDAPGEYYALAVWGVDGPAIMEFVD